MMQLAEQFATSRLSRHCRDNRPQFKLTAACRSICGKVYFSDCSDATPAAAPPPKIANKPCRAVLTNGGGTAARSYRHRSAKHSFAANRAVSRKDKFFKAL